MTDEEFEKAITRIQVALQGTEAKIVWNNHVPDPDNLEQSRQIDVTIERTDGITHVECRHHRRPQDVKWVEELYGRKASLRANAIIGVSSSGFTQGATRKAVALGVFLREFKELSDDEIQRWGQAAKVSLRYVKFEEPKLYLIMPRTFPGRLHPPVEITEPTGKPYELITLFRLAATELVNETLLGEGILLPAKCSGLRANGFELKEVILKSRWRLIERKVDLPSVFQYVNPTDQKGTVEALVQRFGNSAFELHHANGGFVIFLDFSFTPIIEAAFIRQIDIDLGKPQRLIGIGKWGWDNRLVSFPHVQLLNTYEGSPSHTRLWQEMLSMTEKRISGVKK